jgi:hypothetical protein
VARGRSLAVEKELLEAFTRSGRVNEYPMLARDLGHAFSGDDVMRMWRWKRTIEA